MKLAIVSGLLFGYLAQQARLGDYSALLSVLQGERPDWLVALLSATAVVWLGSWLLGYRSRVRWSGKNLLLSALGGSVAGIGMALLGYIPATVPVAFGAGHWDALFGALGLLAGSYVFAECSTDREEYSLSSLPVSATVCLAGWVLVCALLWLPYQVVVIEAYPLY